MSTRTYFDEQNNCVRNTKLPEVNRAAFGAAKPMPADFGVKPEKDGGQVYIKGIDTEYEVKWHPAATATDTPKMLGNKQLFIILLSDRRIEAYFDTPMEALDYLQSKLNATGRKKVCTAVGRLAWVTADGRELTACTVTQTRTKHYGVIGGNKQK